MLIAYEADPPPFDLNEVLNQWEDWNPPDCTYAAPTYTASEAQSLALVAAAWKAFCEATPSTICSETSELLKPEWAKLMSASRAALRELQLRGRLSEEFAASIESNEA